MVRCRSARRPNNGECEALPRCARPMDPCGDPCVTSVTLHLDRVVWNPWPRLRSLAHMIFHPTRKEPGMISIARTSRAALVAAAALAIAAPIASAKPIGPVNPIVSTGQAYQGTYRPLNTNVQLPPDRQDKVGTLSQATNIHQLPVTT